MATVIETGGGIGEAIRASSQDLVDLLMQRRQLGLRERAVESQERRREMMSNIGMAELLFNATPPDATVAESPIAQEALRFAFGRVAGEDFDPASDPRFQDVRPNPLSPDDRVSQMRIDLINELQESEDPQDQEAGRLLQEALVTEPFSDVTNLQDLRRHELEAATTNRGLRMFDLITSPTTPDGEENPLFDERKLFNLSSKAAGVPLDIDIPLPTGETMTVPEDVASSLVSSIWNNSFKASLSREEDQRDRLQDMVDTLVETADESGISLGHGGAETIISLSTATPEDLRQIVESEDADPQMTQLARAAMGDEAALQSLQQSRPEMAWGLQAYNQGLARAEGLGNIQIAQMHPTLRAHYTSAVGLLQGLSESLPAEEVRDVAEDLTEEMCNVAEDIGVSCESLPRFERGLLGFSSVTLPRTLPQDATTVDGGEGEGDQPSEQGQSQDEQLFDAAQRIISGESSLGKERVDLDLNSQGVNDLRQLIAILEAQQGGENE